MQFAVIDLGTNGFRLNIAESNEKGQFTIIHRQTSELRLASEGIHHIGDAPFQRGLEAMIAFAKTLQSFDIQHIRAFGTAGLRLADNGQAFMAAVKKETNINIELISGDREAVLIYKGMRLGIPLPSSSGSAISNSPVLMVDVGGGSVEFIICNDLEVFWSKSFNVGVTILKQDFHFDDVLSPEEIVRILQFLNETCADLRQQVALFKPQYPIIACGTLDFLVKILIADSDTVGRGNFEMPVYFDLSKQQYTAFYDQLMPLSQKALANMPQVPTSKAEMLAVSLVLMDWIMNHLLGANKMVVAGQSMKAGILYEMSFLNTNFTN